MVEATASLCLHEVSHGFCLVSGSLHPPSTQAQVEFHEHNNTWGIDRSLLDAIMCVITEDVLFQLIFLR